MDTPNKYKSVIPSEMTERELNNMCRDIQTAIDRKLPFTRVRLQNDMRCRIETSRLKDYQGFLNTVHYQAGDTDFIEDLWEEGSEEIYTDLEVDYQKKYERYINRLNK